MDEARRTAYGQYCPISRALEVLGERWALLIMRDLIVGATRFNELARGLPGLSRSLLAKRLRQLERAGLVDHLGGRYLLTEGGRDLEPVVFALGQWGARWSFEDPHADELDAELLVWWMHTRVDTTDLPGRRHVLHVRFSDDPRQYWIVVEDGVPSVCRSDPGFGVDLGLCSDVATLYKVWLGRLSLGSALRSGALQAAGATAWTRRLSTILQLSPVAALVPTLRDVTS
ncbi:MAG: winged helix-turn-helix transcriptional regulator [Ornithinimicrobium sp.]|jgi:DNA-binding HxlR family transcriptional regulator|uniref:winged helix-turn-helix transcriptional regulator n=1 Tax=Ornithinimicrobium sp. TaxID=1977084 RepID=UPI003D9B1904